MGSLDIKTDQKDSQQEFSESMVDFPTTSDEDDLLELISDQTSSSDGDVNELRVHPPSTFNEENASYSSSTSSSDFTLEDPFQDAEYSLGETTNKGSNYTIESPPIQTMERSSPPTKKHRKPLSVLDRKESSDSLFSIGMSFRNQDSINWRSGDLDLGFGIEPSPSRKPTEVGMIPELDETSESDASDKDDEFLEEGRHHKFGEEDKIQSLSEIGNNPGSSIADEPMNLNSQGSKSAAESRNSFAFPILTGDANKGSSARITGSGTEKSESQLDTEPNSEPQPEPDKKTEPSGPKADPPAATWTNCFGCCTFCS